MDARAINVIRMCLPDDVLFKIVVEKTIASLWTKLESLYMTKSLNIIYLKRKFDSLQMKEGTIISNHLNSFNTLLCRFFNIDVNLEGETREITLLFSFPESWDHFVTSISFTSTDTIEFDVIVGALLSNET